MLRTLRLDNVILVETATVDFAEGMNVITGETGAGKSAILAALALLLGQRAQGTIIRHGARKATIEGLFDIAHTPAIPQLLADSGIDHEEGYDLVVRRDLLATGKSRTYINNQLAHLGLLKKLGGNLLDIVGQHANKRLLELEYHRHLLDAYGDHKPLLKSYQQHYQRQQELKRQLEELTTSEGQRLRDIEACRRELQELDNAALRAGEEEELFAEYSMLTNADELQSLTSEVVDGLQGDGGALNTLLTVKNRFEQLCSYDDSLSDNADALSSALIELQEIARSADAYRSTLDSNPQRLQQVGNRLSLIDTLKRKYGGTVDEVLKYQTDAEQRLDTLENADLALEELEHALTTAKKEVDQAATALSQARQQTASILSSALTERLRRLNMPQVEVDLRLEPRPRSSYGDEVAEIFMAPNPGEAFVSVRQCASGGEMARLMLAIKALLSGQDSLTTLVFDEIDANIGGETANVVAETLHEIGQGHQLICVTHFPQVARRADHHIRIRKTTEDGRTTTQVNTLNGEARQEEIARMLGGEGFSSAAKELAGMVLER